MLYQPPFGSTDPDASYVDRSTAGATRGAVPPGAAIEDPQREIVDAISKSGITPADTLQLAKAMRSQAMNYFTAGGTANAMTITPSPAFAALSELVGVPLRIKSAAANTGAMTLSVSGLAATAITRKAGAAVASGDWPSGIINTVVYDGTAFRIQGATAGEIAAYAFATTEQARALAATDLMISPSTLKDALYQPITTVASATSMNLSTTTGEVIYVTGTASIGALGTMPEGTRRTLRFTSTPTLVHSAALYLSNGGNNIAIQAGDTAHFVSTGSGNWLMLDFQRWTPIAPQATAEAGADNTQIMTALRVAQYVAAILASQAVAEAGSDNTKLMTPLRVEQHMLANALGWGQTLQDVSGSRTAGVAVQNATGRPIAAWISQTGQSNLVEQSDDGTTYRTIGRGSGNSGEINTTTAIVPHGGWLRVGAFQNWQELR